MLSLADCWVFLVSKAEIKTQTLLVFSVRLGHVRVRHRCPPAVTTALGAGGCLCAERPRHSQEAGLPKKEARVVLAPVTRRRLRPPWGSMAAEPQVPPSEPPVQCSQLLYLQHRNTLFKNSPIAENDILPAEIRNAGPTCHLDSSLQPNR